MLALTGCTAFNNSDDGTADGNGTSATTQTFQPSGGKPTATLSIASGSENKEVAVAIQKAADQSNVAVTMHYMGSLEIMNALKAGGQDHDAVWPASSMWISMGDTKHIVKDAASTSTTPIVFASPNPRPSNSAGLTTPAPPSPSPPRTSSPRSATANSRSP